MGEAGDGSGPAADGRNLVMREEASGSPGLILHLTGELDVATAPALRARLDRAVKAGVREVVVDLGGVTFIDSVSLAALVAARARLGEYGRLAVVAEHPFVSLVLEASGLDSVLDVFEDCDAARAFAFASEG